jgi:hypothetical protein
LRLLGVRHLHDAHVALHDAEAELGRVVDLMLDLGDAQRAVGRVAEHEHRQRDRIPARRTTPIEPRTQERVEHRVGRDHHTAHHRDAAELRALDQQRLPTPRVRHVDREDVRQRRLDRDPTHRCDHPQRQVGARARVGDEHRGQPPQEAVPHREQQRDRQRGR